PQPGHGISARAEPSAGVAGEHEEQRLVLLHDLMDGAPSADCLPMGAGNVAYGKVHGDGAVVGRGRFLDALPVLRQVAVAVAVDVEPVAVQNEPRPRLGLRAKYQQTIPG